jgi:hypothetical protein
MKHRILNPLLLVGLVVATVGYCVGVPNADDLPYAYVTREKQALSSVLAPQDDLRELFCGAKALEERTKRKVAVLEMRGYWPHAKVESQEVVVQGELKLRAFLDLVKLEAWKYGEQPQVKIVKRNVILQSALFNDGEVGREAFYDTRVEPGDIILVSRVI